jgi:hypothetical protein
LIFHLLPKEWFNVHTSTKQSWKTILSSLPGMVWSKVDADLTTLLTASSTLGQERA